MSEDFVAWHNIKSADLQTNFDKYYTLGYRFVSLSIYGTASAPLFAAVWEPMSPIPLTRFGLTANDLATLYQNARFDSSGNLLSSTTMPLSLDVYGDPGDRRYAVVLAPNTASTGWNGDGVNETAAAYQTRFDLQNSIGCRPYLVSPTDDNDYASVFRDDQIGPWQARHGLTAAQYQKTFNTLTAEGYFPIQVQGGGSGGNVRLAAVFTKTEIITPRTLTVTGSPASAKNDPYDAAMLSVMKTYGVRHAGLALVQGTRLVLARGYTYAEPGYPIAQPTTAFRQASCSKTITAILIHQLLYEGKLTLSDTLQNILKLKAPGGGPPVDPNFSKITVGQLLDHISGLTTDGGDATIVSAFQGAKLPITSGQLASWLAGQNLVAPPGTAAAWAYNNFGYMLLGQIAAHLRGTSYGDAVAKHIATPLGLKHTRLAVAPLSAQPADEARYTDITMPVVQSVVDADQRLVPAGYGDQNYNVTGPAGGMSSAAVDMARILAALSLTAKDNPLLAPSEITAMFQAATATFTNTMGQVAGMRGHGWDYCQSEPNGGWYAQKGGSENDNQSCVRYSTNDIGMAVAWAHSIVGSPNVQPNDWYPDFPEVIGPASKQDWGSTDLFPTFGMPSLK